MIDERKGRRIAEGQGIPVIGLIGVVLLARERKIIPLARELLARLESEAGVYITESLRERALRSVGE